MTAIATIVNNLKKLEASQDIIVREIMENNTQEIEFLQSDQLLDGLDATGKKITPKYRNAKYARFKNAKNSKPGLGTPDLKLTGKYHNKMQAKVKSNEVEMVNTDSKDADLSSKYGKIKGFADETKTKLRKLVLPELIRTVRRLL